MSAPAAGAVLAVDLGASSGRVVLGEVGPDRLELSQLARFRNGPVRLPDGLYWDVLGLYQDILGGLREARTRTDVVGVAVDSWAVDYGLLDDAGRLLGNPVHYRDERCTAGQALLDARIAPDEQYDVNGLQHIALNTVNQLSADGARLAAARTLLLVPDLIGYWLSGTAVTERTNASTTGLLDARSGEWSAPLLELVGVPAGLLAPLTEPGTVLGGLSDAVRAETGLGSRVLLSTVGSHDTASAVLGVPAPESAFAFISLGTWGLVGVELDAPVLGPASAAANFTNERGVDGTVRYLRNVMGLWLLSECLRDWELHGTPVELAAVLNAAAQLPGGGPVFDVDSADLTAPGGMPARITDAVRAAGGPVPSDPVQLVRCIVDSLVAALARGVRDAVRLSDREVSVVHIVGGGSQNALLCQLVADELQLPVVAGPVEATAMGNVLLQARTHGLIRGDRWQLRELIRQTHQLVRYRPRTR